MSKNHTNNDINELVENKIRTSIIPTTKTVGIITGIMLSIGLIFSGNILDGIIAGVVYISSVLALVILLDGFAEIITLLRKISQQTVYQQSIKSQENSIAAPSNTPSNPNAAENHEKVLMEKRNRLGIFKDGKQYVYKTNWFDDLETAISYAERQEPKPDNL